MKTLIARFFLQSVLFGLALTIAAVETDARGVSPYLPLQVSPEIEREIKRLFTIAGMPLLRKPYFAGDVEAALRRGCQVPSSVCANVEFYLDRYKNDVGLTDASALLRSSDDARKFVPNQRGMQLNSGYSISAQAYWQPTDHFLITAAASAFEDEFVPTSYVSFGSDAAQVDIGWRERWWSPFHDGATLISTNALPSPSISISNYRPMTFLNFRYEVFYADLEKTDGILFQGERSPGSPGLFGAHLGFEPLPGLSIAVNRVLQFGGDGRSKSLSTLLDAFFDPSGADNRDEDLSIDDEAGNQLASITSRFDFTGEFPFSIYMEYAGEDTSSSENFRLGNAALSVGLFLPQLTSTIDLTYEFSEFQNGWYVNAIYANGFTNDGSVIGHWAGNERVFGDAVGTQVHTLMVNWEFAAGNLIHGTYRTIDNANTSAVDYVRGHEILLRYSRGIFDLIGGLEVYAGRTTLDDDFATIGAFLRW